MRVLAADLVERHDVNGRDFDNGAGLASAVENDIQLAYRRDSLPDFLVVPQRRRARSFLALGSRIGTWQPKAWGLGEVSGARWVLYRR